MNAYIYQSTTFKYVVRLDKSYFAINWFVINIIIQLLIPYNTIIQLLIPYNTSYGLIH